MFLSLKRTNFPIKITLVLVEFIVLSSSQNYIVTKYCYLCMCTDCQLPQDSWCFSPASNYLARDEYIVMTLSYLETQVSLEEDGRRVQRSNTFCALLSWEEQGQDRWIKVCYVKLL